MDTEKRLEDEFREFISRDDLPYYLYIHDRDGVFTYVSANVTDLLGFTVEEFKDFYLNHATANPLNKEMIRYTQQALKGIQQKPYKVEVYDKEYNPHMLYIYERPVSKDEKIIGVEGVAKLLN
jgi:PAS domain S-box-containing protein